MKKLAEKKNNWARALVRHFEGDHRSMPWRSRPTPYRVWISEVMLQQTQVATVIPYFLRFLGRFPDVRALAAADLQDVLKLWEGLGYYSRARNLHAAARQVVGRRGGRLPQTAEEWRALPGIGRYTANAIASIAFGEKVPVVDGNVVRVFSRFWALGGKSRGRLTATLYGRLGAAIRDVDPSSFNQGAMELGALVCKPRDPKCGWCPLSRWCRAFRTGRADAFPARRKTAAVPHHEIAAGVIWKRGRILIARRRYDQMLGGLWEFPGGKREKREPLGRTVAREIREETGLEVRVGDVAAVVKHAYSHFRITLTVFRCEWVSGTARPRTSAELKWIWPRELKRYPMPRANRKIVDAVAGLAP